MTSPSLPGAAPAKTPRDAADWPTAIRATFEVISASPVPMMIAWGDQRTCLFNDAFHLLAGPEASGLQGRALRDNSSPVARLLAEANPRLDKGETVRRKAWPGAAGDTLFDIHLSPWTSDGGEISGVLAVAIDVTETMRGAEHQQHLLFDLRRRVRNVLAILRSIVVRTRDSGSSPDELADHLCGRIDAVARIQSKLIRSAEGYADLEELLHDELAAQAGQHLDNVSIEGPSLVVPSRIAETLGLVFHELATNALKFGGLSRKGGYVAVTWEVNDAPSPKLLQVHWVETGVPAITRRPRRTGFGLAFLEEGLPYEIGAEVEWKLKPGGVTVSLAIPLRAPSR